MKWQRGKRSPDLRDQRAGGGGGGIPGRGGGFPIPTGRMGGGGLIGFIIIVILFFVLRGGGGGAGFDIPDPTAGFPQAPASGKGDSVPKGPDPEAEKVDFVSFVLDDAQGFWEPGRGEALPARPARPLQGRGQLRLRAGELRDRPVLLPARPAGLRRSRLLRRAQPALPGAR